MKWFASLIAHLYSFLSEKDRILHLTVSWQWLYAVTSTHGLKVISCRRSWRPTSIREMVEWSFPFYAFHMNLQATENNLSMVAKNKVYLVDAQSGAYVPKTVNFHPINCLKVCMPFFLVRDSDSSLWRIEKVDPNGSLETIYATGDCVEWMEKDEDCLYWCCSDGRWSFFVYSLLERRVTLIFPIEPGKNRLRFSIWNKELFLLPPANLINVYSLGTGLFVRALPVPDLFHQYQSISVHRDIIALTNCFRLTLIGPFGIFWEHEYKDKIESIQLQSENLYILFIPWYLDTERACYIKKYQLLS